MSKWYPDKTNPRNMRVRVRNKQMDKSSRMRNGLFIKNKVQLNIDGVVYDPGHEFRLRTVMNDPWEIIVVKPLNGRWVSVDPIDFHIPKEAVYQ